MANNKLMHIWFDVDMRASHPGLIELARKKKVNLKNLQSGECALFLNRAQNRVKMFSSGIECLLYLAKDHKIDPEAIRLLPKYFNGEALDYDGALREAITKHMERKRAQRKPGKK